MAFLQQSHLMGIKDMHIPICAITISRELTRRVNSVCMPWCDSRRSQQRQRKTKEIQEEKKREE